MKYGISAKKFNLANFSLVALLLIIVGIILNIGRSFLNPDNGGEGNFFIMLGFVVAVIGLFVHVLREKW